MNTLEALVMILPIAAGGWAAWALPRWAGEHRTGEKPGTDWGSPTVPSQPYADLRRVG